MPDDADRIQEAKERALALSRSCGDCGAGRGRMCPDGLCPGRGA